MPPGSPVSARTLPAHPAPATAGPGPCASGPASTPHAGPVITWSRAFAGTAAQARTAREFLRGILGDEPEAGDAVLCLSELVANAVMHSNSARPGGQCTVAVQVCPGWLRVEVRDQGGPWHGPLPGPAVPASPGPASPGPTVPGDPGLGGQHGRGLQIVAALADRWGRSGDSSRGWGVWYEMKRR